MTVLPQFPLRAVLFPSMILPLHIFEPRYRTLVDDILHEERCFGVVMIEKGLDTGGQDQRSSLGTVARIVEAEPLPDGRWAIITVGVDRYRVTRWLPDDPYPKAEIEYWPDEPGRHVSAAELDEVATKFRRCMALVSEAGVNVGTIPERFDDLGPATMQMSAVLPIGTFDKQKLLGAASSAERLELLDNAIDDTLELIDLKLRGG